MNRTLLSKLSPKLKRLHQEVNGSDPADKQARYCLPIITQHIFNALRSNPRLAERALSDTELPHNLVMKDRLVGELNLSYKNFKYTGRMLNYYILSRKTVRNYAEMRHNISRTFKAELSYANLKYIRLFSLAQLSLDIHVPLETMIYGTTNSKQIALYNYIYFDSLTKYEHAYLLLEAHLHKPLYSCITKYIRPYGVTYHEIASQCGVSRQSVSEWVNHPNRFVMVRTQRALTNLCRMALTNPVSMLKSRDVTRPQLLEYVNSHIKLLSPRKRWLNESIKWKPATEKERGSN